MNIYYIYLYSTDNRTLSGREVQNSIYLIITVFNRHDQKKKKYNLCQNDE